MVMFGGRSVAAASSTIRGSFRWIRRLDGFEWKTEETDITPGDQVLLYTDGWTDARNENEDTFGIERLTATIEEAGEIALAHLTQTLALFSDATEAIDDVTALVLSRQES
jgi:serine phosphatase RsbU (regulator of sigma subunit)|tara:strand:+ start:46746 stop:47075 length:330 start_codon:yes stop_codon:yes gene_type:complete